MPSALDSEMGLQNEMGTYYSTLRELFRVNAQPILVTQVWKIGRQGCYMPFLGNREFTMKGIILQQFYSYLGVIQFKYK